jgi:hypothetical protein
VDCGQHLNHDTARDPIVTRRSETNLRILDIARSALDASYLGMDANRALRDVAIGYNEVDALMQEELDHLTAAYRHVAVACALWEYENGSQEYVLAAFASAKNLDDSAIR